MPQSEPSPPEPPESAPGYITDGLPKQDTSTLRSLRTYIDRLIEYREQDVSSSDLPQSADPVDDDDSGKGTVAKEKVRCGDDSCHCMDKGGEKHGPYLYRYFYQEGDLKSNYIGKPGDR